MATMEDSDDFIADLSSLPSDQPHPCAQLFMEMFEELTSEDLEQMKALSKDKLEIRDISLITEWSRFFELLKDKFSYQWDDMIKFLINVAITTERYVNYGQDRLHDVIERHQAKIQKMMENHGITKDKNFVGREREIKEICRFLDKQTGKITGVCICGLAGMGKTTVANEVCYKYGTKYYISKRSLRGIRSLSGFFSVVLGGLNLPGCEEAHFLGSNAQSVDVLKETVYKRLQEISSDFILFLDNLEDVLNSSDGRDLLDSIREMLNISNGRVKLVITTRQKLVYPTDSIGDSVFLDRFGGSVLEVELKRLAIPEAKRLLKLYSGETKLDNDDQREIVQLCGLCPLLIKIMADHLRTSPDIRAADVKARLQDGSSGCDEAAISNCLNEMFAALPQNSKNILVRLSVFETSFDLKMAEVVMEVSEPKKELDALKSRHLVEVEDEKEIDEMETEGVTDELKDLGLPKRKKKHVASKYSFHPLMLGFLQQISGEDSDEEQQYCKVKEKAEERFYKFFVNHIRDKVGEQLDKRSDMAFAYIQENTVHLRKIFKFMSKNRFELKAESKSDVEFIFSLSKVRSFVGGRYEQSYFCQQLARRKEEEGDELFVFYMRIQELINQRTLENVRKVKTMREQLKTMLPNIEVLSEDSHPLKTLAMADYYGLLGRFALDKARYQEEPVAERLILMEALDYFKSSLKCYEKELPMTISEVSQITNCMGCVYYQLREFDTALQYHKMAFEKMKNYAKKGLHGDIPNYLVNIGTVYHELGKQHGQDTPKGRESFEKALQYYADASALDQRLGFPEELVEARRLRNKADIYRRLDDYQEAAKDAFRSFRLFQRHFQPPHTELTTTLHLMGFIQYSKGNSLKERANNCLTEEAEQAYLKALRNYGYVRRMIETGGLSKTHSDYYYIRQNHLKILGILGKKDLLTKVQKFYCDFEAGKFDSKIRRIQREMEGESSGSENLTDSEEEEEDEEDYSASSGDDVGGTEGDNGGGAVGGAAGGAHPPPTRQDSGFDDS